MATIRRKPATFVVCLYFGLLRSFPLAAYPQANARGYRRGSDGCVRRSGWRGGGDVGRRRD